MWSGVRVARAARFAETGHERRSGRGRGRATGREGCAFSDRRCADIGSLVLKLHTPCMHHRESTYGSVLPDRTAAATVTCVWRLAPERSTARRKPFGRPSLARLARDTNEERKCREVSSEQRRG